MAIDYKREVIGENISLTVVRDDKFKTCAVNVNLLTKLSEDTACVKSIIPVILSNSNANYPDRTQFNQKLASLYGARIGGSSVKISDIHVMTLLCSSIRNDYALERENIAEEVCDIFLDCIFNPVVEEGGFAKKDFAIRKQEHIDYIQSLINEKRSYAVKRAYETVFENEPFAVNSFGTEERARELDPVTAYDAYKDILKTAEIEIFVVGGGNLDDVCQKVKERFSKLCRNVVKIPEFKSFSPVKNEVARVCEPMEVNQSKMVMAYKSDYDNIYVCKFMSAMLGGTAFSKLFTNVREKLSLCYYCASRYVDGKGTLVIDSGVDTVNIELAQKAINEQLEELANGNFTDELLENTRLVIYSDIRTSFDSLAGIASWYMHQRLRGTDYSTKQVTEIEKSITREQIIECAKTFKLDSVYVLESKSQKEGEV